MMAGHVPGASNRKPHFSDELRAPSSMMKLMTAEVVFHAIKEGDIKLTDEYRVSENAWRRGGAPAGGSTMFAAIHSKISVDDLLHGAIIQSGNDACIVLAEAMAGNERAFATDMMTKRAREIGLPRSTFANSNGLPDPGNKMTVRELAKLARYIMQTYPEVQAIMAQIGRPDDGTDPTGFYNVEFFVPLKPQRDWPTNKPQTGWMSWRECFECPLVNQALRRYFRYRSWGIAATNRKFRDRSPRWLASASRTWIALPFAVAAKGPLFPLKLRIGDRGIAGIILVEELEVRFFRNSRSRCSCRERHAALDQLAAIGR